MKRDVQAGDEVGIRVKEQSIIELGKLFAKTRQAQGKQSTLLKAQQIFNSPEGHVVIYQSETSQYKISHVV